MDVYPDGFIGMVMASEGISDGTTLLHGPDGCRKNLTVLSSKCYPRPSPDIDMSTPFYRGMSRIPCTGVESNDYIFGSYQKIKDALEFLKGRSRGFITIISTPGASLIGDDSEKAVYECGMDDLAVAIKNDPISLPLGYGYDLAMSRIVSKLVCPPCERRYRRVNVLGASILLKDWSTIVEEFTHLLDLMGLEVGCFLGAGCTVQEIRDSGSAEFNIVLLPEYAEETAELYQSEYGVKKISPGFAPVGFDRTEKWLRYVAEAACCDCSEALVYVRRVRSRAYRGLTACRCDLRGQSFVLKAEASVAYPLTEWLITAFSLVPDSITLHPGSS